jgi:beta-lactamase regulating signal transducer with metallopeptidase domain
MPLAMNPGLLLSVVAAVAAFLLKTTLAFATCLVLTRLVQSANARFILWSGFVFASAGYWLWLAQGVFSVGPAPPMAPHALLQAVVANPSSWRIPDTWALPLGLTLRALGVIYLLVLGFMCFTHARRRRHLKWVLGFTSEPPMAIAETFQSLAKSLSCSRARLLVLSGATSPATFGSLRPTILLPTFCLDEDSSELEDILRHELHHVRRWDSFCNGLALACRALLFFQPAVWYAVRKMQFERELACDLAVVSHCPARKGNYAECLLRFAQLNLVQESRSWGIDFAASSEHLTVRVHSILGPSKTVPAWLLCLRTASALTLSALFLGIAPSLAVPLSYAPRPVSMTPVTEILSATTGNEARRTKKIRAVSRSKPNAVADVTDAPGQETRFLPESATASPASEQGSQGPQLLHRSSARAVAPRPETVELIDADAAGQRVKNATTETRQTLQQTATAALALYKRASDVDRH